MESENLTDFDIQQTLLSQEQQRADEDRRRVLLREVDFGLAIEQFLAGPIGKRLLDDAEAELKTIYRAIVDLNPEIRSERNELHKLRFRANVLQCWQDWFGEYIVAGRNAEKEIEEGDLG